MRKLLEVRIKVVVCMKRSAPAPGERSAPRSARCSNRNCSAAGSEAFIAASDRLRMHVLNLNLKRARLNYAEGIFNLIFPEEPIFT